jgi:predicted alpha/beta-fold hydrolase
MTAKDEHMSETLPPAAILDSSFSCLDFRPLPLLRNPHVQTVLGLFLSGPPFNYPTRQQVVWLPDGDGLLLYDTVPPGWRPGDRIAVLIHGLTGSHASPGIQRLARLLLPRRVRVVRLDLRGAGKGIPLARATYHGGRSNDLRAALAEVHRWSPTSPLVVIGQSLGGNIALKLAGEAANRPVPGLERVGAMGPPIDLGRCAALLGLPSNRLYENYFLRGLIAEARQRQRYFPDLPPLRFPRRMTMRLFDDLYTAPRCGFTDALDYYRRGSALPLVGRIQVPTLILSARDDPFIAAEPIETLEVPDHITVRILPHGGHLGFLGWDGAGGFRWAERRIVDWAVHPEAWVRPPRKG